MIKPRSLLNRQVRRGLQMLYMASSRRLCCPSLTLRKGSMFQFPFSGSIVVLTALWRHVLTWQTAGCAKWSSAFPWSFLPHQVWLWSTTKPSCLAHWHWSAFRKTIGTCRFSHYAIFVFATKVVLFTWPHFPYQLLHTIQLHYVFNTVRNFLCNTFQVKVQ